VAVLWVVALPTGVVGQGTEEVAREAPPTHYMGREIATTMHWSGAGWLIRATREREEAAELMLSKLGVKAGMTVGDLGCGNGYHALKLAQMVGEGGVVIGVDIQQEMLDLMMARAHAAGVKNVKPVLAGEKETNLAPGSCDIVLMVDVYHEVSWPAEVLASVKRALKEGGKLVLVEYRLEDPEVPIKPVHKMTRAQMDREMKAGGFKVAGSFDELPWQHMVFYEVE
jgi:ubiquinone/menaquinone biosynthesis C-methylase UbiE